MGMPLQHPVSKELLQGMWRRQNREVRSSNHGGNKKTPYRLRYGVGRVKLRGVLLVNCLKAEGYDGIEHW